MSLPVDGPLKSGSGELENPSIRRVLVQWVSLQKQARRVLRAFPDLVRQGGGAIAGAGDFSP